MADGFAFMVVSVFGVESGLTGQVEPVRMKAKELGAGAVYVQGVGKEKGHSESGLLHGDIAVLLSAFCFDQAVEGVVGVAIIRGNDAFVEEHRLLGVLSLGGDVAYSIVEIAQVLEYAAVRRACGKETPHPEGERILGVPGTRVVGVLYPRALVPGIVL